MNHLSIVLYKVTTHLKCSYDMLEVPGVSIGMILFILNPVIQHEVLEPVNFFGHNFHNLSLMVGIGNAISVRAENSGFLSNLSPSQIFILEIPMLPQLLQSFCHLELECNIDSVVCIISSS